MSQIGHGLESATIHIGTPDMPNGTFTNNGTIAPSVNFVP